MLEIRYGDDGAIVLSGRFDASQAQKAEVFFEKASGTIIVDCANLQYISSLGLGTLVKTQKRLMSSGGRLKLVNVTPHIRDVLTYSGLHVIFEL